MSNEHRASPWLPHEWAIVQAGLEAPSADNRHTFEVQRSDDGLLVLGNQEFLRAPYHRMVLGLITFGAVVENMTLRAAQLGFRAAVTWRPDSGYPALIARLALEPAAPRGSALADAISTRHTNRRLRLAGPALDPARLAQFGELLQGIEGVRLDFYDTSPEREHLLRLIRIAEGARFNNCALHRDLFSSVRFDVGWNASAEEGLPPGALGVERGMRRAFAQLRHWPVMNALCRVGFHHALGLRAGYLPGRLAPHRGVISTDMPVERGAMRAGMALQRIWLAAESQGLAFQPLAGSALLALPEYHQVPAATGDRLREGWKELTERTPLMVFRMGHADPPAVRAGRPRHLEKLLRSSAAAQ